MNPFGYNARCDNYCAASDYPNATSGYKACSGYNGVVTVSVTVDNILLLRHVELDGQLERIISVIKIRDSGFDPAVRRYTIGPGGVAIGAPLRGVEGVLLGLAHLRTGSAEPPTGPGA